jgi:hypothetical protein
MMNEETEQFERRLSRQPLRPIPAEWREEILREGRRADVPEKIWDADTTSLPKLNWLAQIFWPSPAAWAGLAAVWLLILAVDFSIRDKTPVAAEKFAPQTAEVVMQLRQQQRLLAELMGPRDTSDADRSKPLAPRPRSERAEFLAV